MRYLITKEKILYVLAITFLCILMGAITGVFYNNVMSIEQTKTVVSVILSFWLGLLTPIVLFKTK
tara:strand:+ start:2290 stop:2484 length:195 start_codon:yes stop_codon:yes gene_type:complete